MKDREVGYIMRYKPKYSRHWIFCFQSVGHSPIVCQRKFGSWFSDSPIEFEFLRLKKRFKIFKLIAKEY